MRTLKVLNNRYSLPEALDGAVAFRLPAVHNDEQLFKRFAVASQQYSHIAEGLHGICRNFIDYDFEVPEIAAFDVSAAALRYQDTCQLMTDRVRQAIDAL